MLGWSIINYLNCSYCSSDWCTFHSLMLVYTDKATPLHKPKLFCNLGSGCASVGRVVTSIPKVHGSNPLIGKIYIDRLFSTVNCIEETK